MQTDDVDEAVRAADMAFAIEPTPREGVELAHDIYNRQAQGILNRAMRAAKLLGRNASEHLKAALRVDDPGKMLLAVIKWIEVYRAEMATLLTTTQLASLLEGAREVAKKIPAVPMFPHANPPATLEPKKAMELLERLGELSPIERDEKIINLPPDQQEFIRQGLIAQGQGTALEPPPFEPHVPAGENVSKVHFPVIDEAARELASKNVMNRYEFDALDASARQKAFTIASVDAEETLEAVRDVMARNIAEGVDLDSFRESVLKVVDESTFLNEGHLENVFRTNVQTAFSDGQMVVLNHPFVRSGFPYARYDAIRDDRVRHDHLEMEKYGIQGSNIYRVNDPVFQLFRPPWSWMCVPGNAVVITDRGHIHIDKVQRGDKVLTHLGRFRSVLDTHCTESVSELVSIELESGSFCRATAEHPFLTKRGWIEASRLNVDDEVYQVIDATSLNLVVLKVYDGLEIEDFLNGRVTFSVGPTSILLNFNADIEGRKVEIKPIWKGLLIENKIDARRDERSGEYLFVTSHTNNTVNVLSWIESDRFSSRGDHLRSHFGTAASAMNAIGRGNFFDSAGVESVTDAISLSNGSQRNVSSNEDSSQRTVMQTSQTPDIHQARFLLDVIDDSGFDAARIAGKPCFGVLEIGGRSFWLFPHKYNCNTVETKIKKIEWIKWGKNVHNISVEEDESFICDGIVTHNCRCSWTPITIRQAAEDGIEEAQQWMATKIEPTPPAFVSMPPFAPPPTFRRSLSGAPLSVQLSCQSICLDIDELRRYRKDKLKGGKADNRPDSDFEATALAKGIKIEMEHTNDPELAKEIAKDHLAESPRYYDELEKMENYLPK